MGEMQRQLDLHTAASVQVEGRPPRAVLPLDPFFKLLTLTLPLTLLQTNRIEHLMTVDC